MSGQVEIGDEDFIPFLNKLGVDTYKKSFEWMLNDPDFSGVLRWIYNSIDESNALSAREEYRFGEIEKKGSVLLQEDLDNSIAALQQDYPGICIAGDITGIEDVKLDINGQTERLDVLERHEQCLNDILKQNELANEELNVEITKLNAALQQSTEEETAAKEECIKLAQEVESMTNQVTDEVAHILGMYERCKSDKEIAKRFFAFGPFDAYRQSQEVFKCNFDLYSSKMYYKTQCEHVSHNNLQTAFVKAHALEERFAETVDAYIDSKANLCGEQAKLGLIRNFSSLHPSQVGVSILEAKSKLDLLERESSLVEDEVLSGAVREYVERRTRYALDVTTRTSLAVREQVLRDLRFLVGGTRQALAVDRVLYSALRCELGAAERLLHFADQLRDYWRRDAEELRCRTKSMSDICLEHSATEPSGTDIILPCIARLLGAAIDGSDAVRMGVELWNERKELLDSIRDSIQDKEDGLEEFKKLTKQMMEYIYDGCTRRPNGRERGAAVAHALRHAMDQVDDRVIQTSGMFNTVKNGDKQNVRKLWQWFLAEPARLLALIRHAHKK